ncbi:DUF4349 domain-containing protein [Flavobacterium urocaniciphilum]|uniref:DUF4349 domain-containing protein n=1 Tax=Flavobacterium urocaniciphilum TaxID=1299341 RepID=A0A1H8YU96_9FLAO|nr:DUF4349 domain-containing protein [Flavobacterium urocaniciphilum]SEP55662.1 protein of unknown function [Flavobacterium urocaniciphilum]
MITKFKIGGAIMLLTLTVACNKKAEETYAVKNSNYEVAVDSASVEEDMSSSAAVEDKNSKRKFIRTADARFKVKDVAQSTYKIENLTKSVGGFVTLSELRSNIIENDETQVSQDSLLQTTRYEVNNTIALRVPNVKLDTLLRSLAKEVQFLDYRVIKADDVNLQILTNELSQKRNANTSKRLENAIDKKGNKLKDINDSEENLALKKENSDNAYINNLSLKDQVNFSTVTLELYQNEKLRYEMVANEKNINAYRPNLGLQIWESIKSGWFIFEGIIAFLVQLWPIVFFTFLAWLAFKKWKNIKKVV